jgi:UDPglucose 6-dehydrogenase
MVDDAMDVAVVGTGYVGLVTGVMLAHLGHRVTCVDQDAAKVEALRRGEVPIYEPGLGELMPPLRESGRLSFTTCLPAAVRAATVVFICVGTPMGEDGAADLSAVAAVARGIGEAMDGSYRVIVDKSTVPVGTGVWVSTLIGEAFSAAHPSGGFAPDYDVVSNPEFLREGTAIADAFYPDRIVVGSESERALLVMEQLYAPLIDGAFALPGLKPPVDRRLPVPVVATDITSAEMTKYAANAFLVMKISFINEIAAICERVGADVTQIAKGIGYDQRIGHRFLQAGLGWGGSCFPKDLSALRHIALENGYDPRLLAAAIDVNLAMRDVCLEKLERELGDLSGKTIGLLGLAFKPHTDDMRDAPARTIADHLQARGATVRAFDPVAMEKSRDFLPHVEMTPDPYALAEGCDGLVLVTDWPQFRGLDLARLRKAMRQPVFIDGRNVFEPAGMHAAGFRYQGFGRL